MLGSIKLNQTPTFSSYPHFTTIRYQPLANFCLEDEDDPAIQAIYPLCVEPTAPTGIGLQCSALSFLGRTVQAGEPWWRQGRPQGEGEQQEG